MSDEGEFWRDVRAAGQVKRAMNREDTPRLLADAGIKFVSHNGGAHLTVDGVWSIWPGTGKWRHHHMKLQGRGWRTFVAEYRKVNPLGQAS